MELPWDCFTLETFYNLFLFKFISFTFSCSFISTFWVDLFLYLENKCNWFVNINALPFLIRKEEFYGSKILHSCSFCKLKWIFNLKFYYSKIKDGLTFKVFFITKFCYWNNLSSIFITWTSSAWVLWRHKSIFQVMNSFWYLFNK